MNNTVSANDLKIKGVSILESVMKKNSEALITIRGKITYIVIPHEKYNNFREYELLSALEESRKDIALKRYKKGSIEAHIKRITNA